jgi:hypothetical protein
LAADLTGAAADGDPCVLVVIGAQGMPLSTSTIRGVPAGARLRLIGPHASADLGAFGRKPPLSLDIREAPIDRAAEAADIVRQEIGHARPIRPTPVTGGIAGAGIAVAGIAAIRRAARLRRRMQILWEDTTGEYHVVPIAEGETVDVSGSTFIRADGRLSLVGDQKPDGRAYKPGDEVELASAECSDLPCVRIAIV